MAIFDPAADNVVDDNGAERACSSRPERR